MKKIVCEICGSQSIKKENGFFVCQECGTEYTLEETKKLLQECEPKEEKDSFKNAHSEKEKLLKVLSTWLDYILSFKGHENYFEIPGDSGYGTRDAAFWDPSNPNYIRSLEFLKTPSLSDNDFASRKDFDYQRKHYFNDFDPYQMLSDKWTYSISFNWYSIKPKAFDPLDVRLRFVVKAGSCEYKHEGYDLGSSNDIKDFLMKVPDDAEIAVNSYRDNKTTSFWGFEKIITEDYTSKDRDRINEYTKRMREFLETRKQIKALHKELYSYCSEHFEEMKETYASLLEQLPIFIDMFDLPLHYRHEYPLSYMIDCLQKGRAETWKEVVNLYEEKVYKDHVTRSLDSINRNLISINQTLTDGFYYLGSKLSSINASLESISSNVSKLLLISYENNYSLKQIMFDTRYALISGIIK